MRSALFCSTIAISSSSCDTRAISASRSTPCARGAAKRSSTSASRAVACARTSSDASSAARAATGSSSVGLRSALRTARYSIRNLSTSARQPRASPLCAGAAASAAAASRHSATTSCRDRIVAPKRSPRIARNRGRAQWQFTGSGDVPPALRPSPSRAVALRGELVDRDVAAVHVVAALELELAEPQHLRGHLANLLVELDGVAVRHTLPGLDQVAERVECADELVGRAEDRAGRG